MQCGERFRLFGSGIQVSRGGTRYPTLASGFAWFNCGLARPSHSQSPSVDAQNDGIHSVDKKWVRSVMVAVEMENGVRRY